MTTERDERRRLTRKQRARLYVRCGGVCQSCRDILPESWHAHHVTRWADGGVTNLTNMTALCPKCHKETHETEV